MKNIFLCLVGIIAIYYVLSRIFIKTIEGYESIYYNMNDNSNENQEYSKTVDLHLTFPFSCKNFCGPVNKCAITDEQCSDDYDCHGCQNIPKLKPPKVEPHYRELSNDNDQMDYLYPGSKNNLTPLYYSGGNEWINNFNEAMKLYNRKEIFNTELDDFEKKIMSVYPTSISMTGQYYETTPSAYNNK